MGGREMKTVVLLCGLPLCLSLAGDWAAAKAALRSADCCVVSVSGLEPHLRVLQARWTAAPEDLDLRTRVRVRSSARDDCRRVSRAVSRDDPDPSAAAALEELARGVSSLADGPLEGVCDDVFLRVVCASDYRARDPTFHTDKAPLRGYVTLRGPGTEYLHTERRDPARRLRRAEELEFIVMKGTHYSAPWLSGLWRPLQTAAEPLQGDSACVHRSPPAATAGETRQRRVIVSLDLATGDDDREWHVDVKREWRCGLTQRKSFLVA